MAIIAGLLIPVAATRVDAVGQSTPEGPPLTAPLPLASITSPQSLPIVTVPGPPLRTVAPRPFPTETPLPGLEPPPVDEYAVPLGPGLAAAPKPAPASPRAESKEPPPPFVLAWLQEPPADTQQVAVASNGYVVTLSPTAGLEARSPVDGYVYWSAHVTSTAFLRTGPGMIFTAGAGHLDARDATTGLALWAVDTGDDLRWITTAPSLVIICAGNEIRALHPSDGHELWRASPDSTAATPPAIDEAMIFAALSDKTLLALDRATGAPRWRIRLDEVPTVVTAGLRQVIVGTPTISACAFEQANGHLSWCQNKIQVAGAPMVEDDSVVAALFDASLRVFAASGGTERYRARLAARPGVGPLPAGTYIAAPLSTGAVDFVHRITHAVTHVPAASALVLEGAGVTPDGTVVVTLGISPTGTSVLAGYQFMPPATPLVTPPTKKK